MQSNQEIRLYVNKNIAGKRGTIFLALFCAISNCFLKFDILAYLLRLT